MGQLVSRIGDFALLSALSWRYDFQWRKHKETWHIRMGTLGLGRTALPDHHADLHLSGLPGNRGGGF